MHSLLKSPFRFRLSLNFSYSHCWCYVKQFAYVTLFSCLKIALRCIPPIFILVDKQGIVNAVLRCSPTLVFPGSSLDTQKGGLCWENQMRYAPGCILCKMYFMSFALSGSATCILPIGTMIHLRSWDLFSYSSLLVLPLDATYLRTITTVVLRMFTSNGLLFCLDGSLLETKLPMHSLRD